MTRLAGVVRCWHDHRTAPVKAGDQVEDFTVLDQNGSAVTLTDLLAGGPLVLYFYIKAMTPG